MFGYVRVNEEELKIREYATYRAYYCGLCMKLKEKYGQIGRLSISYDMTFLIILLSSLYEPKIKEGDIRCIVHPKKKRHIITNEVTEYGADMNMLLFYEHMKDDWNDERKKASYVGEKLFRKRVLQAVKNYPVQTKTIRRSLAKLVKLEKEKTGNIDAIARPFGELLAGLFLWKRDPFSDILKNFGFYLGKFIYIMDAYMDYDSDVKKNCYNPFIYSTGYIENKEKIREILDNTLKQAIVEFEKLPLENDVSILRNILYEGVWGKFYENNLG